MVDSRMEVEEEECREESEVEPDSDHEDETESQLSQWLGELENYAKGLDVGETDTVRRRNKTVVTPKMTMESFRNSFLNETQEVNFDAILGELCELEHQLSTTQSDLSLYGGHSLSQGLIKDENRDSGNDLAQAELDALASEITRSLGFRHKRPMGDLDYFSAHYPGDLGGCTDAMFEIGETDSAFSESASLPSSESFTSMVTVSSSVDPSVTGDSCSTSSGSTITPQSVHSDEEQKAILQAEKIRIALEKIKEAKIKKLFVRAFAADGSSKSIMVDEKMTIGLVISILADKNHVRLNPDLAVIEHMPELYMERILEDHDSLVENMVMWTRDTKNKITFETRQQKNDLFKCPEKYLLVSSSSEKGASLDPKRRQNLIQEFFSGSASKVPEVDGVLYLKSDGKKAWKKFYFVLRASGLYYNPKGKLSKSLKDLVCLVQFEFVELYNGLGWKKKYHAPTDFCFALKHPQIQKKTSKFIRYLCAENKAALDQWIMGIRIAKYGKQLLTNYQNLQQEILTWDTRDLRTSLSDQNEKEEVPLELNPDGDLQDSRLSLPEPGSRHSIVNVKNSMLVKTGAEGSLEEIVCLELNQVSSERKSSLPGSGPVLDVNKPPVKRVSFSNTHSVINADSGEELVHVRHRDSITSASTDSSEDSTSSGEGKMNTPHRSKMRPKLPVTTGTTKQISEMVQSSFDNMTYECLMEEDWQPPVTSPVRKEFERRKSHPAYNSSDIYSRVEGHETLPMSPTSPRTSSPQHMKGGKIGSSQSQKVGHRSHSRGSSISSVDSSDSYQSQGSYQGQGHCFSPTSLTHHIENDQGGSPLYEAIAPPLPVSQGQQVQKQAPPTAAKPAAGKKLRPQSTPSAGPVDMGHRRTSSKSSLESVEEVPKAEMPMITHPTPVSMATPPAPQSSSRGGYMTVSPPPPPGASGTRQIPPKSRSASQPCTPTLNLSSPQFSQSTQSQPQLYGLDSPVDCFPTPAASQAPAPMSPPPVTSTMAGPMSPRPALHRHSSLTPTPVSPPVLPPMATPPTPPLVPPTPRNPAVAVKTHKRRPSGDQIVIDGSQPMSRSLGSDYPDIAMSRPPIVMLSELPLPSASRMGTQGQVQGQEQFMDSTEDINYAPLPFMAELNKHMHKTPQNGATYPPGGKLPPETLPKPGDHRQQISKQSSPIPNVCSSQQNTAVSLGGSKSQQLSENKKTLPPPPPKRSETTKLSSNTRTSAESVTVPNDPIYGNCDGMLDINDLPPPPPELLEGYTGDLSIKTSSGKGKPPPPPPPKRSKETQITSAAY